LAAAAQENIREIAEPNQVFDRAHEFVTIRGNRRTIEIGPIGWHHSLASVGENHDELQPTMPVGALENVE
jgi:hypothetical protein